MAFVSWNHHQYYFIKEFDNQAIFPGNSGRFNQAQIDAVYSYEVHGDQSSDASNMVMAAKDSTLVMAPFGSYSTPMICGKSCIKADMTKYSPASCSSSSRVQKKAMVNKTFVLVTLSNDKASSKSNLSYSPSIIAKSVSESVGFDVILLDCKCYPLLDNASTSSIEFWKSTRKILAASKNVFQKLSGTTAANFKKKMMTACDDTSDEDIVRTAKRPRLDTSEKSDKSSKLELIIEARFSFIDSLTKSFECVVCKSLSKKPCATSACCQRILGCNACIERWIRQHLTCPHCSATISSLDIHDIKEWMKC